MTGGQNLCNDFALTPIGMRISAHHSQNWMSSPKTCADCDSLIIQKCLMISSPGSHFCGLCQAETFAEMSSQLSILNATVPNAAVVLISARQEQWMRHCQLDMCSHLQDGAQPQISFLRTVLSDSLQRWAHSWTILNTDISIEWCSADYG